jgi:ferredoxin
MSYRIEIDPAACSGHGDCAAIAPEVFALEETAVVIGDGPDELVLEAAAACPALAITVVDADSGSTVFP